MKRSVSVSADWCHICGLAIPNIYDHKHLIYGTIDHVIPLSKGGSKAISNRRAAHRICNYAKENKDLSGLDRDALRATVQIMISRMGLICGPKEIKRAKGRATK
jgi:hypothetical protein